MNGETYELLAAFIFYLACLFLWLTYYIKVGGDK